MDERTHFGQRHAPRADRNGRTTGPAHARSGLDPVEVHGTVDPADAPRTIDPAATVDRAAAGAPPDDRLAPIGDAIAALPRPALSPVFRARLHGDLVRLESVLAAESARPRRRWEGLSWLHRREDDGAGHRRATSIDPWIRPRRAFRPALGVPAVLALSLAFALFAVAGLTYAAERSAPGDPLWPVHSAFIRWRTGRAPAARDAKDGSDRPAEPTATAGGIRSIAVATIVRRTGQRPNATSGPVLPIRPPAGAATIAPTSTPVLRAETRRPSTTVPRPTNTPPAAAAAERRSAMHRAAPSAPAPPTRSAAPRDPGRAAPTAAAPSATLAPSALPPTLAPTATATASPTPGARSDTATLSGTVRLRAASVVAPLAGVTVALALVAPDFPTGCDPMAPPAAVRTATTNADGDWTAAVPSGRWIIAVTGGCLGSQPLYLADFNGATAPTACAALALPVADGSAPTAHVVVDIASAPGCGPVPTATP